MEILRDRLVRAARLCLQALLIIIPLGWGYLTRDPYAISWINIVSVIFILLIIACLTMGAIELGWPSNRYWTITISLFVAALLYAGFFSHPLRNAIGVWVSRLFQPLFVGYGAYLLARAKRLQLADFLKPVLLSLVPLLVLGALQATGHYPYHDTNRITANYLYPNTFARYVVYALVLTLPWLTTLKANWRLGAWLIWLLSLGLLIGSQSFGATIAFFVALLIMVSAWPESQLPKKRSVLATLVIGFILIGAIFHATPKWQTSLTDSLATRQEFWQVAWGVTKHNFWTGIGLKTWEHSYAELVVQYGPGLPLNWASAQPHDVYLDSFVKAGLPGFIGIIGFVVWPVIQGALALKHRDKNWYYSLALVGLGITMLVFGLADDPIWSDDVMPLIAVSYFLLVWTISQVEFGGVPSQDNPEN